MTNDDLMPFGKYKDNKMEDVPAGYLIWLYDAMDQDWTAKFPDLKRYIDDNYALLEKEVEGK